MRRTNDIAPSPNHSPSGHTPPPRRGFLRLRRSIASNFFRYFRPSLILVLTLTLILILSPVLTITLSQTLTLSLSLTLTLCLYVSEK